MSPGKPTDSYIEKPRRNNLYETIFTKLSPTTNHILAGIYLLKELRNRSGIVLKVGIYSDNRPALSIMKTSRQRSRFSRTLTQLNNPNMGVLLMYILQNLK